MNDLDTIIRDALLDDATRAPRLPETWGGPATSFRDVGRRRSRHLRYAALAGAAAVIIVALALLIGRSSVDRVSPAPAVDSVSPATAADRVSPATGWQPPGTEFPSQDLGPRWCRMHPRMEPGPPWLARDHLVGRQRRRRRRPVDLARRPHRCRVRRL